MPVDRHRDRGGKWREDTWKRAFSEDKEGRKISEELKGLGMNWDAKMVSRIDLD